MTLEDPSSEIERQLKAARRIYKLASVTGAGGLGVSAFLTYVYYAHIFALPDIPIEAVRYMALTHSIAAAHFTLSFALGLIALINYSSSLSFKLMLASAATALAGYIPPCERLWRLGYTNSLNETVAIATIHIALIIASAALLHKTLLLYKMATINAEK